MKKLLFVLAFFATIAFIGCSDDDNDDKIITSQIVGKWQLTRIVGYEIMEERPKDEWDEDCTADNEITVFDADGTGVETSGDGDIKLFDYSIYDNILIMDREDDGLDDNRINFTIKKLNSSEMVLYQYVKQTLQGMPYEFECTYYYVRK